MRSEEMIGRRIDSTTVYPPTKHAGDYGFSQCNGEAVFWCKPPLDGIPSLNVEPSRVIQHWRWPWQKHGDISVRGPLVFYRGLGADRHVVWAGFLTKGVWE